MSRYDDYIDQQRRQYAKSVPIANWRKQLKNSKSNQELLNRVRNVPLGRYDFALDIGAGEGYHTEDLRKINGYNAFGIELLEKRVADAHKLGRDYIQQGDAHNLPFADNSMHLVFMHEVIEHCAYPVKVLKEVYRVLIPGGQLLISLPLEGYWKKRQSGIDDHNLSIADTHVWKPTAQDLWDTLTKAGFDDFRIDLHELNTIRYRMQYRPGTRVHGFRPHAFVDGNK
jgi:SAM-dependent methyltransferase